MSLDWEEAGKWKPQGIHRELGPNTSPGLRLEEVGKSARTQEQRVRAPACQTWILTLEAGQIGILGFGFQQMWQPCIAVPEPTALGVELAGGQWGRATPPSSQP